MAAIEGDVRAIAKILLAGVKGMDSDAEKVGKMYKREMMKVLGGSGGGRTYTTGFFTDKQGRVRPIGSRTPHTASAPGQSPAKDSGDLQRSIGYRTEPNPSGATVVMGSTAKHALYTEEGTRKMLPRPWFRKTILAHASKATEIWAKGIEKRERAKARQLGGAG